MSDIDVKDPAVTVNPPQTSSPGQKSIFFLFLVVLILGSVGGYLIGVNKDSLPFFQPKQVACTMDAMVCPDGSSVGRTGPNCEFAPCPISSPISDSTSSWKMYTDNFYQFSFQYPQEWQINCNQSQGDLWLSKNICDLTAPGTILDHGQLQSGAYIVVGVSKPDINFSNLIEYVQFSEKQDGYKSTKKTLNNIVGYELTSQTSSAFAFESKNHFLVINWIPLEENNQYFTVVDQILSTFKFLD